MQGQGKELDVVIIGTGVTGLHQLYEVRKLGLSVRAFDNAGGVGGTWWWARYPGCRFDSEAQVYAYGFSEELGREWVWNELYTSQGDIEKYLNHVADKFDLRRDIQLNSEVTDLVWQEQARRWKVVLSTGEIVSARFVVAAVGILSAPAIYIPDFPGLDKFKGQVIHACHWPQEGVNLKGRRVAVFGTGSTGVQLIPIVAEEAEHLTVYQRTPTYTAPLRNARTTPEQQKEWQDQFTQIIEKARTTQAGFLWEPDPRNAMDVPREERLALYEKLWEMPGFAKWLANFQDIGTDQAAAEDFSEFVRNKIRARFKDKELAEKFVPKDHLFATKRPPMETNYYEAYERPNVDLVEVRKTPVIEFLENGIRTNAGVVEVDLVIFATGFDALTGGLTHMNIVGRKGETFREAFKDGPRSNLNLMTSNFPNFFTAVPRAFCNFPRCSEVVVDWITRCLADLASKGCQTIEATPESEVEWDAHVASYANQLLAVKTHTSSWFDGSNIPGKPVKFLLYPNTLPGFRQKLAETFSEDYKGFVLA